MSKALMTGKEQIATGTTSGIVKLSDVADNSQDVNSGYAVTPKAIAEQVTNSSIYKECFVWRNLQLAFTDGGATFDATDTIGTTSALVGFAMFPYNNIEVSKVVSDTGTLSIWCRDKTINGTYYTSIVVFFQSKNHLI